jgi:hypothetical protein
MEVASMLKSKDALVPFKNFNFGNKWSLTAMEKAMALPLHAGFTPNSAMPILDVSNWLLLTTVSTTGEVECCLCTSFHYLSVVVFQDYH